MIGIGILIVGCGENVEIFDVNNLSTTRDIETVGAGESCVEKSCAIGLECDSRQICVKSVVENVKCQKLHAPVCARKGNRKNGYLNECEARRHGAEFLSDGLCKVNEKVDGDCESEVLAVGNCTERFSGWFFDGKNCVERVVAGCEAEIPFFSQKKCEEKCN